MLVFGDLFARHRRSHPLLVRWTRLTSAISPPSSQSMLEREERSRSGADGPLTLVSPSERAKFGMTARRQSRPSLE
jgi:hypothetical protein